MLALLAARPALRSAPAALARAPFHTLPRVLLADAAAKPVAAKPGRPRKAPAKPPARKAAAKKPADKPAAPRKKAPKKPAKLKLTPDMLPPRLPASAYLRFLATFRATRDRPQSLQAQQALVKEAAAEWHVLPVDTREKYIRDAQAERAVYRQQRDAYYAALTAPVLAALNKRRVARGQTRMRNPHRVRRPLSSYLRFTEEFRATPTGQALLAIGGAPAQISVVREAAKAWRALPAAEKSVYAETYHAELALYRTQQQHRKEEAAAAAEGN